MEKNRVFFQITGVCATLQCNLQIMNYIVFHCASMGTDLSGSTVLQCRAVLQCSELKWSVVDWGASNSLHCFYSIDCITLIALHCFHSSDCIALHSFHWLHCTSHLALHCSKCIALLACELQCIEKLLCVHTANEDSFCSAGQLD